MTQRLTRTMRPLCPRTHAKRRPFRMLQKNRCQARSVGSESGRALTAVQANDTYLPSCYTPLQGIASSHRNEAASLAVKPYVALQGYLRFVS